jgi:pyruvate dehydrogenase E2 component (dihydrolipoamide acetyltransferase)
VIETDKAEVELTSPSAGTLGRHRYDAGATIPVGEVVAYVLAEGEADPSEPSPAASEAPGEERGATAPEPAAAAPAEPAPHRMSPRARRAAREQRAAAPTVDGGRAQFRAAISEAVMRSWHEIPHFAVSRDLPGERCLEAVRSARAAGAAATITDVLVQTFAQALEDTGHVDAAAIGLAVATEAGVALAALESPARRSIAEIAERRAAAVERTRSGRAAPTAMPLATVSNLGQMGVTSFTGIIPEGQRALLTVGAMRDELYLRDGTAASRPVFSATLNLDHRHLDGAHGAEILRAMADRLEPEGA